MPVPLAVPIISGATKLLGGWFGKSAADKAADAEKARIAAAIAELEGIGNPNYIPNADYQYYDMPEDVKYQTVSDVGDTRNKMVEALDKMRSLRETGLDTESERQFLDSSRKAGQFAKGRTDAALNSLEARGMGTSGLNLLARLKENQDAAEMVNQAGMTQASAAAQGREQANADYLTGEGNLRAQDINLGKTNADIINDFNKYNSKMAVDTRNANTMLANQMKQEAVNSQRDFADDSYSRVLDKAKIKAGFGQQASGADYAKAGSKASWYGDIADTASNIGSGLLDRYNEGASDRELDSLLKQSGASVSSNTQPGSSFTSGYSPSGVVTKKKKNGSFY